MCLSYQQNKNLARSVVGFISSLAMERDEKEKRDTTTNRQMIKKIP
jgi:hypothetical protein